VPLSAGGFKIGVSAGLLGLLVGQTAFEQAVEAIHFRLQSALRGVQMPPPDKVLFGDIAELSEA
jgi:hypothetical protein